MKQSALDVHSSDADLCWRWHDDLSASRLFAPRRSICEGLIVETDEATTFAPAIMSREPSTNRRKRRPMRVWLAIDQGARETAGHRTHAL
jgi:hypothetical protein